MSNTDVETFALAHIRYLDNTPLRTTRAAMHLDPSEQYDELAPYRDLAASVLVVALVDLGRQCRGLRITKSSPHSRLAGHVPLDVEARATATQRAHAMAQDPSFVFWCTVANVDPCHVVRGALRRILAGDALRFADHPHTRTQHQTVPVAD